MPTAGELGLTEPQWERLAYQVEDQIYRVKAYRWNPQLATLDAGNFGSYPAFAAIEYDGSIYRINTNGLQVLVADTWTVVADFEFPDGYLGSGPPSMVVDGDDLMIFASTTAGIALNFWDGLDWAGWEVILADATVSLMSASGSDRVHFVTYDSTNRRFRFKCLFWDGDSWEVNSSQIYWGFQITSLSAARIDGVDTLVFTSETPGVISNKVVNTKVVKEYLPAMAVCGLRYKYSSWSDHFFIDYVDMWMTGRFRSNVRLSQIGDTLWMSTYSSEADNAGVGNYVTGYRVYNSKDGRHWSRGELFPLPRFSNRGVTFLVKDQILYAFTNADTYSAPLSLWFSGDPSNVHPSNVMDISSRISSLSVSRQDMQQLNMTLHNPGEALSATFFNGSCTVAVIVETGIRDAVDNLNRFTVQGIFELDVIQPGASDPQRMVDASGRDHMAWMSSRSQSEQFHYWEPQVVASDDYTDYTDSGYGGMGRSAVAKGSWKTIDGYLVLVTNNEEGQIDTTYSTTATWNGSFGGAFQLSQLANNEYMGVKFRSQDKDNYWRFRFDQASDKLKLEQVIASVATVIWESSAKSWSDDLDIHWLRVNAYYCRIRLYSYTGISTSGDELYGLEQEVIIKGQAAYDGLTLLDGARVAPVAPNPQSGFFGIVGKGYYPTDTYPPPPPPLPPPSLPPGYPLPPVERPLPPTDFWGLTGNFRLRPTIYTLDEGDWELRTDGLIDESSNSLTFAMTSPYEREVKWLLDNKHQYKGRIFDEDMEWEPILEPGTIWGFLIPALPHGSMYFDSMAISPIIPGGRIIVAGSYKVNNNAFVENSVTALLAISDNNGATWRPTFIFAAQNFINRVNGAGSNYVHFSGWDACVFLLDCCFGQTGSIPIQWKSCLSASYDGGDTWTIVWFKTATGFAVATNDQLDYPEEVYDIRIPFRKDDGSPNRSGAVIYAIGPHYLYRSDDGGAHWERRGAWPHPTSSTAHSWADQTTLHISERSSLILTGRFSETGQSGLYRSYDGGWTWVIIDDVTLDSNSYRFQRPWRLDDDQISLTKTNGLGVHQARIMIDGVEVDIGTPNNTTMAANFLEPKSEI